MAPKTPSTPRPFSLEENMTLPTIPTTTPSSAAASATPPNKPGRGKSWSVEEDQQLALSWVHVSENPVVGSGQNAETFYSSIQQHMEGQMAGKENHAPRTMEAVKTRWLGASAETQRFAGYHSKVIDCIDIMLLLIGILTNTFTLVKSRWQHSIRVEKTTRTG